MRARVVEFLSNRWLVFVSRVVLGAIFLTASIGKVQQQAAFIDLVKGYGILPDSLAQAYGLVVPWVELFIGCCLILGVFSRFASALSIPLTLSFVIASSYALINDIGVNCGCFGEVIILSHPVSLSLDCLMLATALAVLFSRTGDEFLSAGHLLSRYPLGSGRRKRFTYDKAGRLAVVALAMAVVTATVFITGGARESFELQIDTALEQTKPVFTYFYAEKCSACEEIEPLINELEHEYGDRIAFIHIDYWEASRLAEELGVGTTPTMLLITGKDDDGQYIVYQRFDKSADEESLRDSLEQLLQSSE